MKVHASQSIGIELDPHRTEPLHRQIFDQVVERIETRAFPPGFRLPPTRTLAKDIATHRNTVARAYGDLEAAGFVTSRVGRGTFVEARTVSNARPSADRDEPPPNEPRAMPWTSLLSRVTQGKTIHGASRYARRLDQKNVINLARMQPSSADIPHDLLRRCVARALAEHGPSTMAYAPPEGAWRLRVQIAEDLVERGVPVGPDDILVTSGSQQGLDLLTRALIDPGDTVLVEPTTYSGAIDVFRLAGARLVPVPTDAQGPDPGAFSRLTRPDVKALYVMPNAHNPLGRAISAERRRALVAWSRASGVPIIEDDYAAGLTLDDRDPPPHLRALDGDVIHVSTLSKRLVPALRVGYIVAPTALRAVLCAAKQVIDLGTSLILQNAIAEFMERGYLRAHARRMSLEYRARRDALDKTLRKAMPQDVTWHVPNHGVVLWLRLPTSLDPEAVFEEALRRGVLVSPSPMWSVDGQGEPGVRLAFCAAPEARVAEGARRLGKAIKHLLAHAPRRTPQERALIEVV